jgi:hypothetical protein
MTIKSHLLYFRYLCRHKWFVLIAGLRLGVGIVQLITHDWSKFLPSEWFAYVAMFYGGVKNDATKAAFNRAWNHHQKRQPHHWQYWLLITDQPSNQYVLWQTAPPIGTYALAYQGRPIAEFPDDTRPMEENARYLLAGEICAKLNRAPVALPMPEKYVREMVADWMGAGRAITGRWEVAQWYAKTREHIIVHPDTRARVEELIRSVT